jgi:hypothetical protein
VSFLDGAESPKLSSVQRSALAELGRGKRATVGWETGAMLMSAGLVSETRPGYSLMSVEIEPSDLTAKGREVAAACAAVHERRRRARNVKARGHASAMRSLGMKRTRSGGWE